MEWKKSLTSSIDLITIKEHESPDTSMTIMIQISKIYSVLLIEKTDDAH